MSVNAINVTLTKSYLSTSKSDNTNTTNDDSFNNMVKSSTNASNDNSNKKVDTSEKCDTKIKDNKNYSKPDNLNNIDNEDSKIEDYLKEAGFTDDEINDIKEKIDQHKIDKSSVHAVLSLLFANNPDIQFKSNDFLNQVSQELNNKILDSSFNGNIEDIKDILNKVIDTKLDFVKNILGDSQQGKQLTEKLSQKIVQNIISKLQQPQIIDVENVSDKVDLKLQIYTELVEKLSSSSGSGDNLISQGNTTDNRLFQVANSNTQLNNSGNKDNSSSSKNGSKDTDVDVLNKILNSSENDNKISKAVNFMTQFNNIKSGDNVSVESSVKNFNIDKNSFVSDIIKSVKYMEVNNVKEMTVKISPKDLGNITINLVMEEGKMKAVLTASNKEAYNLLNSNVQDLSNKLQTNEIKIQNFSLSLYHEDTTFFKDGDKNRQNQGDSSSNRNLNINNVSGEEEIPQQDDYYNENNVDMLA